MENVIILALFLLPFCSLIMFYLSDGGNKSEGLRDLRSSDTRYALFRGVGTSTRDLEYVLSSIVLPPLPTKPTFISSGR